MKTKLITCIAGALLAMSSAIPLSAQGMGKMSGKATDINGQPIVGAHVEIVSEDTGQKLVTKTDKSGNFFQIGVPPANYKVSLVQNGTVLFFLNHVAVHLNPDDAPTEVDFDLKKEAAGKGAGTAEGNAAAAAELRKRQLEQARETKIASLNQQLTLANTQEQAGQWDQAISTLTAAANSAPQVDLLWFHLGNAEVGAGDASGKSGDKAAADGHYQKAVESYTKAIDLKPKDAQNLASYHNNLGQAYVKSGKPEEAVAEYTAAAQTAPAQAAMFYFNLGAILTNQATKETNPTIKNKDIDAADEAFDKATQADPNYGEAWYQKGINLLSKATYDKAGNIVAAPGTTEAFQKYLVVSPTGSHVEEAKSMIASLGGKVQTSYRKPKSK